MAGDACGSWLLSSVTIHIIPQMTNIEIPISIRMLPIVREVVVCWVCGGPFSSNIQPFAKVMFWQNICIAVSGTLIQENRLTGISFLFYF